VVETKGPAGPPHGPAPSLWPLGFAIGLTVTLVGLVINSWGAAAVGAVVMVACGFVWMRDALTGEESTDDVVAVASPPGTVAVVDEVEEDPDLYRRGTFLGLATLGLGGVITGMVALPVAAFAVLPAFVDQGHDEVDIGPIEDYPEGDFVVATFLSDPEQGEVSRRTAYVRNNGLKEGVPSFTVLSNRCVHLGCPVQVNGLSLEEQKQLVRVEGGPPVELTPTQAASGFGCPCHGGQYDTEGNRVAGPPVRALDRYRFLIRDGRLVLTEPYSVGEVDGTGSDAVIKAYDWVNPSVHVDGIESILYPLEPPH
jgi:Rieske Fe-S protein